ncbi:MAG TPA: TetR/AcrR family transcriptional regulator [Actinocatenispora sp.]
MSRSGGDLRVRRTRKLLRDALIELIEERGFDKVTVGAVTERAMVSRAAFYRGYRDKYQLVEQVFDEAMAELLGSIRGDDERSPRDRWTGFFEHIDAYHRFYRAMLGRRGSPWFAERMRAALSAMVAEHLAVPDATALVPTMLGAMLVQAITWWLEHDRPESPAVLAARTAELAGAIMTTANAWTD